MGSMAEASRKETMSEGGDNKTPRTYYCTLDYALGMEKRYFAYLWLGTAHICGFQGIWWMLTGQVPLTILPIFLGFAFFAGMGVSLGVHRLWTHRSFKAKLPLQLLLAYMQTMSQQYPIFKWCRDHRIHHKYTDTDADPHNSLRGFWFSHLGWHFVPEHPSIKEKEATIDLSDLDNDPIIRFQTKYFFYLIVPIFFIIPMSIIHFFFPNFTLYQLFCLNYVWYLFLSHVTGLVNSLAHSPSWGMKPYDQTILPSENLLVTILSVGEGFHNFHHAFPWDCRASELGRYLNTSTRVLDFFTWIGWAYDCKVVSPEVVMARVRRTGDVKLHEQHAGVTHPPMSSTTDDNIEPQLNGKEAPLPAWGWGDEDISEEHRNRTRVIMPSKAG